MPFDKLPYDALVVLFEWLEPKDRLNCTEVCRIWNEAVSFSRSLMEDISLKVQPSNVDTIRKMMEDSRRQYRRFRVVLGAGNGDSDVIELLKKIAQKWDVRYLRLDGEARAVQHVMRSISLSALIGLYFEFPDIDSPEIAPTREVVLENLKYFHCHGKCTAKFTAFRLVVPNLEQAKLTLENGGYYHDNNDYPLLHLLKCEKLKHLELDLKESIWRKFLARRRPFLEHLVIRQANGFYMYQEWNTLFTNVPNLRRLEIKGQRLRNCGRSDRHVHNYLIDIGELNIDVLEHLHLQNVVVRGRELIHCQKLSQLTCRSIRVHRGVFSLFAPNLTRLIVHQCKYSVFKLRVGSRLQALTLYCLNIDLPLIDGFFLSLQNLHELTLAIDERSMRIINRLGVLPNLSSLTVTIHSEIHISSCNNIAQAICSYYPAIKKVTIANQSVSVVRIGASCYALLNNLGLQRLEVRNMVVVD